MNDKNLTNKEYWEKRALEKSSALWGQELDYEKQLQSLYLEALETQKTMVSTLYTRYGEGDTLSYSHLNTPLSKSELWAYRHEIESVYNRLKPLPIKQELLTELEHLLNPKTLTKLQAYLNQLRATVIELGYQEEALLEESLKDGYKEAYFYSLYILEMGLGINVTGGSLGLSDRAVLEAIKYPWSGSMFSDNIWDDKARLIKALRESVIKGIMQGKGYKDIAKEMDKVVNSKGFSNTLRLLRTEFAYIIEESSAKGYQEHNISQYILIATLDKKTSLICQEKDGKVYELKDRIVGKSYPPFHPFCRTTTAPYFEDTVIKTRIARGDNNQNYKVDGSLTYKKWKQNKNL